MNDIIKAKKMYAKMVHAFNLYSPFMFPLDVTYWSGYLELVDDLIKTGDILDPLLYKHSKWSIYNIRERTDSMRGCLGEIIFNGKVNMVWDDTYCYIDPNQEQGTQLRGMDTMLGNPAWNGPRSVQVKTGLVGGKWVTFYPYWFKYSPKNVHRLAIVDPNKHKIILVDYEQSSYIVGRLFNGKDYATVKTDYLIKRTNDLRLKLI